MNKLKIATDAIIKAKWDLIRLRQKEQKTREQNPGCEIIPVWETITDDLTEALKKIEA